MTMIPPIFSSLYGELTSSIMRRLRSFMNSVKWSDDISRASASTCVWWVCGDVWVEGEGTKTNMICNSNTTL